MKHMERFERHNISDKGKEWIRPILTKNGYRLKAYSIDDMRKLTWLFTGHSPLEH